MTQWLNLSKNGQDARVSHCTLPVLEQCVQELCNATNRDPARRLFRSKHALASNIGDIFRSCLRGMLGLLTPRARHFCLPFIRDGSFTSFTAQDLHAQMTAAFGEPVFRSLVDVSYNTKAVHMARSALRSNKPAAFRIHRSPSPTSPPGPVKRRKLQQLNRSEPAVDNWPQQVNEEVKMKCIRDYFKNTMWQKPVVCAVCGRDKYDMPFVTYQLRPGDQLPPGFRSVLGIARHSKHYATQDFTFKHTALDNLMLCARGVHTSPDAIVKVDVCKECAACVHPQSPKLSPKLPKYALANKLYLGDLPEEFKDLTWVEEQVCALHRSTVFVYRLYHSDNPQDPYMAKGNSCAHPQNTVSTAKILPRTPADVAGCISVVFTASNQSVPDAALKNVFRVRKNVVRDFLKWLQKNNPMYEDVQISDANLSMYGADGNDDALPGIQDRIIHNEDARVDDLFESESSGFESHPASCSQPPPPDQCTTKHDVFIEHTGVYDADNTMTPPRRSLASGLRNLKKSQNTPDLVIPRGSDPIPEYNNPSLFPGMFPSLFPYGLGGFDDNTRNVAISFQKHVEYLLDLADRRFRYHRSFLFIALNIYQRRMSHLHTWLTVKKSRFDHIAPKLAPISAERLKRVADHIERDGRVSDLSPQDQEVLTLMKEVTAVGSNIPGSSGSKLRVRNEIRAYMGYFGMPHLYVTMNPNAKHSPLFHVMWGDDAVDLATRFPDLVDSVERGRRVASDPVTGADFFDFSIDCFLRDLLGWDKCMAKSSDCGGIFGKIRAYYGMAEFTDRGQLHGHFLIWLDGGLNPTEVHEKMKTDPEWKARFFTFFEDIIKHELPDTCDESEPGYEPRSQRPPNPDNPDFPSEFLSEVKKMGECLQRHVSPCKPVCHKYGSQDCRFGFPHEVVHDSRFDIDTNAVVLRSRDPTINWYNPIILTSCRHNHDVKCILSGKSAKAAMFYISDYITKNDEKMWQLLSMFSRSVAANPKTTPNASDKENARRLLHQCLASVIREQKIHGQQAARYLRGAGDGIYSHSTIPMLSHAVTSFVREMLNLSNGPVSSLHHSPVDGFLLGDEDENEAEVEPVALDFDGDDDHPDDDDPHVPLTKDGMPSFRSDQVQDYVFRDDQLEHVCFYDYVRCFKKERSRSPPVNEDRALPRFRLCDPHPQSQSHVLVQHINPEVSRPHKDVVPRAVGCSIPRRQQDDSYFAMFMMAHFHPFSCRNPIQLSGQSVVDLFDSLDLSPRSRNVIRNWDAIHECEDQRDAERLRKQQTKIKKTTEYSKALRSQIPTDYFENPESYIVADLDHTFEALDPATAYMQAALAGADWFNSDDACTPQSQSPPHHGELPNPLHAFSPNLKHWEQQIKTKSNEAAAGRRSQLDPSRQTAMQDAPASTLGAQCSHSNNPVPPLMQPESWQFKQTPQDVKAFHEHVAEIAIAKGLNTAQRRAFEICASKFREILETANGGTATFEPLRLFLTGPGGTGKTYVVNCLKILMERYGRGHCIRFLAPTGTAANLINGQTIHSGIGLKVADRSDNHQDGWDLCATISAGKKAELTAEWKHVDFALIDEVSMMGQDLLCELDGVLRMVRERPDEWFGGINIIFSGDLYQHEPVGKRALFMPVPPSSVKGRKKNGTEAKNRQGRMAWKQVDTVIELTDQKRMENDLEYAAAVLRYRKRQCTIDDMDLFNSRLVRSLDNPDGVIMNVPRYRNATAIVSRNKTRHSLNLNKAHAITSSPNAPTLFRCHAKHTSTGKNEVPSDIHKHFAEVESSSDNNKIRPAVLDLYIGAPIIVRQGNISVELGVTTGAQGFLRGLELEQLNSGDLHAPLAIVEFPDANFQLDGLPQNHFPIKAVSGRVSQVMKKVSDGSRWQMDASRYQLPFELAFAITGHAAQGKTMDCGVACDLNELGAGGYVAASRAPTREGLIITRPVTLSTLNRPLKRELILEISRLDAMAHNTLVRYGYLNDDLVVVPDFESENRLHTKATFDINVLEKPKSSADEHKGKKRHVSDTSHVQSQPEPAITTRSRKRALDDAVANCGMPSKRCRSSRAR